MEVFTNAEMLDVRDIRAFVSAQKTLIGIRDKQDGTRISMYVEEARALRDWLNIVLPASAQETGTSLVGQERGERIAKAVDAVRAGLETRALCSECGEPLLPSGNCSSVMRCSALNRSAEQ